MERSWSRGITFYSLFHWVTTVGKLLLSDHMIHAKTYCHKKETCYSCIPMLPVDVPPGICHTGPLKLCLYKPVMPYITLDLFHAAGQKWPQI